MGFVLVLDQRIALPVGPQPDALAKVLHLREVVDPLAVDRAQHHEAFDLAHDLAADRLLLLAVGAGGRVVQELDQCLLACLQLLGRDLGAGRQREVGPQVLDQPFEVPVLGMPALAVHLHAPLDQLPDVVEDVVAGVRALQHLVPLLVDDLALQVHHVVVLDHVLARIEVHAFDFLLRALDRTGDPAVLDRFHLELIHQLADAVGSRPEDLHQVVLEGDEEAAGPGVALAARPSPKLVVDAPRFMALGADDVQPAGLANAVAEDDVGAAAGHVRRDHHRAALAGVLDDLGLALVELCVQHRMLYPTLVEQSRQAL